MRLKIPTIHDLDAPLDVLHDEVSEFDSIHDIVFHVDGQSFAAHKFVLLSRCPEPFGTWIDSAEEEGNCFVPAEEGLTGAAFDLILRIIYRNHILNEEGAFPGDDDPGRIT